MVENVGENEKEDGVQEIDGCDSNVEGIGLLVHPWSKNADSNQPNDLDNEQADSLSNPRVLPESNKQSLEEDVRQLREDEIIGSSSVLNVEEAPFVESSRIRVKDISGIFVYGY